MDLKRVEQIFVSVVLTCRARRLAEVGIKATAHQLFFSGVRRRGAESLS